MLIAAFAIRANRVRAPIHQRPLANGKISEGIKAKVIEEVNERGVDGDAAYQVIVDTMTNYGK